jgi:CBS-domain-containing membrane protein
MLKMTRGSGLSDARSGWFRRFLPEPLPTSYAERLRASFGAAIGIALTGLIGTLCIGPVGSLPLLVAPMGASAVLLFGVTASPLAQPWSIIGGNLVAALVGVTAARWIGSPLAAAALAIGFAFGIMSLLRCVHPPSGAVTLTAVLGDRTSPRSAMDSSSSRSGSIRWSSYRPRWPITTRQVGPTRTAPMRRSIPIRRQFS